MPRKSGFAMFHLREKCTFREQAVSLWSECLGFPQILLKREILAEGRRGEGNGRGSRKGENIDSKIKKEVFVLIFDEY